MTITSQLPTITPSRSMKREEFVAAMDAWIAQWPGVASEIDAAIAAFNFNSTNSTSTTSLTIGAGTKTITLAEANRSYMTGMTVKIAKDADNWMVGEVDSYTAGTDTLVVKTRTVMGSGTYTSWAISLAATPESVGAHEVTVHSGLNHGSINTKIRRFTTTKKQSGTAITYADSETLGGMFTINETADYSITYGDCVSGGGQILYGVTVNSAELTTGINTVTSSSRIMPPQLSLSNALPIFVTITARLSAGDVVRAHTEGTANGTTEQTSYFSIRKINNG